MEGYVAGGIFGGEGASPAATLSPWTFAPAIPFLAEAKRRPCSIPALWRCCLV